MDAAKEIQNGIALHQTGRLAEAMAIYRLVIEAQPNNPDAHHLLGLALHQSGKDDEAIPHFEAAIAQHPSETYYANFAELWRRKEKWDSAIYCYEQVLNRMPNDVEIRYLMGEAQVRSDRFAEGLASFQQCLKEGKDDSNAWVGICEALRRLERLDEAVEAARKAVTLDPTLAPAWHSLGWTIMRQGKVREALPYINKAIELKPDWPMVIWRRAFANLSLGDFAQGWQDYESRWLDDDLQKKTARNLPGRVWRGEDVRGKVVYVLIEQGLGDYIQMARYIPLIQARGAAQVSLEAPPELASLIERSIPGVHLIVGSVKEMRYHYYISLMSLPLAFGTLVNTVPANVPYLRPDPQAIEVWRNRLADVAGLKVGLVWAGSATHMNDRNRSMRLSEFLSLKSIPNVRFVSLQKGAPASQVAQVPEMEIIDWTDELKTFDDTAALVSALDLVISVDTSVAHLAGALGAPVWTLLAIAPDFRWMLEREDSPWYPTMRLFRQQKNADWGPVIRRVTDELARWAKEKLAQSAAAQAG
ncbi:MAG TPA: tetratricopeptide repeat protein [Tepidisphaeraceae bacterium]|nr:tetratricopeptide repeat protein [Tepidisphaeraceae bacterium]